LIRTVYDNEKVFSGPYADNGPDLVIGYEDGYRASWEAAVGAVSGPIFTDNDKAWQGDHCVDFALVPGVFFCDRQIDADHELRLMDIAPTVLDLFGVPAPPYIDGRPIGLRDAP